MYMFTEHFTSVGEKRKTTDTISTKMIVSSRIAQIKSNSITRQKPKPNENSIEPDKSHTPGEVFKETGHKFKFNGNFESIDNSSRVKNIKKYKTLKNLNENRRFRSNEPDGGKLSEIVNEIKTMKSKKISKKKLKASMTELIDKEYTESKKPRLQKRPSKDFGSLDKKIDLMLSSPRPLRRQDKSKSKILESSLMTKQGLKFDRSSYLSRESKKKSVEHSKEQKKTNRIEIGQKKSISSKQIDEKKEKKVKMSLQDKFNNEFIQYVKAGKIDKCLDLIAPGQDVRADVNVKAENNWTPLHFACWNINFKLVNLLIFNEANVDALARNDLSPLMVVCSQGSEQIAKVLINAGAQIALRDGGGNSALHYAAKSGSLELVRLLLDTNQFNLKAKNNSGLTPLDLASDSECKKFLELKEADLDKKERETLIKIHTYRNENFAFLNNKMTLEFSQQDTSSGVLSHSSNTSRSDLDSSNSEADRVGPQNFLVHSLLGRGSFGEVYLVERRDTGKFYAMKVLYKHKMLKHNLMKYAKTERNVMSLMNHPFIVNLNSAFQTGNKLFLILDYCAGGDLAQILKQKRRFPEDVARIYLCEVLLALEKLHSKDIIFRDLKPDNIVISSEGHALLTDFGLSKEGVNDFNNGAQSFCGSVAYLAPEMLKKSGHGKAVDWYLLGVLLYEMLIGVPPYFANTKEEIFDNIQKAPLKIPTNISEEAKSLLKGLLQRDPKKRLGSGDSDAEEIKSHRFFKGIDWDSVLRKELKPPKPELKIPVPEYINSQILFESVVGSNGHMVEGWSFVKKAE